MTAPIDLSQVPPPDVVEALDFSGLADAWRRRFETDAPEIAGLVSEADPAAKWRRTGAFREGLLRQRINDGAEACMLARATGADLENLVAIFNLQRETLVPADPDADPPVEAVLESDERLRRRAQLFPASISTAGPKSAYRFHALNASPLVKDVSVANPGPGDLTLTVLAEIVNAADTGAASQEVLDAVEAALSDETVRPMGDTLTVQSAAILDYAITAEITIGTGPDAASVLAAARAAVGKTALELHMLGRGAPRSALIAALHVPGVLKVNLAAPAADVAATSAQAARASAIQVTAA